MLRVPLVAARPPLSPFGHRSPRHAAFMSAIVLLCAASALAQIPERSVPSLAGTPPGVATAESLAPTRLRGSAAPGADTSVMLAAALPFELGAVGTSEPRQIGVSRALPVAAVQRLVPSQLTWLDVEGGRIATFRVTSPAARAIRLRVASANVPVGVELRFFSPTTAPEALGPFTSSSFVLSPSATGALAHELWSPVIDGDTVGVEVFVPFSLEVQALSLVTAELSHLILSPGKDDVALLAASSPCQVDLACHPSWSSTASAVAKMVYTEFGSTYLCTGTLLSDRQATRTPYFLTANHCIDTSAVAATLNTFWFAERTTCGGGTSRPVVQLTRGATLLATNGPVDFSLLQLNEPAPAAAIFAGWTTSNLATGLPLAGLHHPLGDDKKISLGTFRGISRYLGSVTGVGDYLQVTWSQGLTEGGSSGSGLFTDDGARQLVGLLKGGDVACTGSNDWYTRFASIYPFVSRWLDAPPSGGGTPPGQAAVQINSDCSVTLTWTGASGIVLDYTLVVEVNGVPAGSFAVGTATTIRSGPITAGTYRVIVVARMNDGSTRQSAATTWSHTCGGVVLPGSASWLAHVIDGTTVTLNWTAVAGAIGYDIEAVVQATGQVLMLSLGNQTTTTVPNVPAGAYSLRVRGRSASGAGGYSAALAIAVGAVSVRRADLEIVLTWNTTADLDLHVIEPNGAHVYYVTPAGPTATLESDNTTGFGPERIVVPTGRAATGVYQIYLLHFGGPLPTSATVAVTINPGSSSALTSNFVVTIPPGSSRVGFNVANANILGTQIVPTTGTRP